jgi:drug/metabolite transporter (DMT)-like permease
MTGAIIAVTATSLLCVAIGLMKAGTARMPPLFGTRPFHLVANTLRSPIWWTAMVVATTGLTLEFVALSSLSLTVAAPAYGAGFVVLFVIAVGVYGERLAGREWLGLITFAVAGVMVGLSVLPSQNVKSTLPSSDLVLAITVPSLVIPLVLFSIGDLKHGGRHSRPVAGFSYGVSIGVLIGVGEMAVKGLTIMYDSGVRDIGTFAAQPYAYIVLAGPGIGIFLGQVALQRSRVVIFGSVGTVMTMIYMLPMATLLYGEAWPKGLLWGTLRIGGMALFLMSFFFFPRYDEADVQYGRVPASRGKENAPEPRFTELSW